jgi:hypothetical protein
MGDFQHASFIFYDSLAIINVTKRQTLQAHSQHHTSVPTSSVSVCSWMLELVWSCIVCQCDKAQRPVL